MNRQINRRSVVTTIVVFVVCLIIVTGSTFSLFTSESNVNIAVTSGKVEMNATLGDLIVCSKDVEQNRTDGDKKLFENGGYAELIEKNSKLEITNMTPGDSVQVTITMNNTSNVDIAYRVVWTYNGELGNYLTATVDDKNITGGISEWMPWNEAGTKTHSVAIELPLDIGNKAQEKAASITFKVEAVQANATAEYDPTAYVNTEEGLQAAVSSGATNIILNEDVTLTEAIEIPATEVATFSSKFNGVILDLNGKTISNPDGYVIENEGDLLVTGDGIMTGMGCIRSNGGYIIIENGNFYASSRWQDGVYQHTLKAVNTKVVIEGGNFDATVNGHTNAMLNASENATITINGGSFRNVADGALSVYDPYIFTYEKNGAVIINGGSFYGGWRFNGETATTTINGGSFALTTDGQSFHASSTHVLSITGGTFTFGKTATETAVLNCVAEGYTAVANENGAYDILLAASSEEDFAAGKGESNIYAFAGDITATDKIYFGANTTNTIILNGKTVTATGGYLFATQGENCVLNVEGDGNVVSGSGYAAFANKYGTVTINGGSFELGETNNAGSLYSQNSGTIVINDGTFISYDANTPIAYCINGFIEIKGGFFQNAVNPNAALLSMGNNIKYINNQKITLSGGTFVNWNPMDSAFAHSWTNPDVPALIVLADGYEIVAETQANGDVWYTVVPME